MIDALFGSKTRVKLLHLFLNHPGESFYVREITRKIDEQINSVRRELSNMLNVGIITSDSVDNKLYYQVNQRYEHYLPLKRIFARGDDDAAEDFAVGDAAPLRDSNKYKVLFQDLSGARVVIIAGVLVRGSTSTLDILIAGNVATSKAKNIVKSIERSEGREINFTVLPYEDFYYRLSVRDRFVYEVINNKHDVLVDKDNVLNTQEEKE
jgi:DNA-binding transcriptional ArsR family regulator